MKATTTRTLNPLPFQDLEPHRFEDLVRQLAYEFRRWRSLEATGRGGADEGLDIRAIEAAQIDQELDEEADRESRVEEERLWIFQCKREKVLAAQRVRAVVEESLVSLSRPPHGFVLAAACDLSKKARDAFREEMVARGVEEFAIWARSELEDMLFQPRNDRLLFAYFGLSLQPRRRSITTSLRSEIAKRKQLASLLDEEDDQGRLILLRDPEDERYPRAPSESAARARWLACRAITLRKPGHLVVLRHEYLAATSPDSERWDAIFGHDLEEGSVDADLRAAGARNLDADSISNQAAFDFWNEYIHEEDRARLKVYRYVPLGRILAVDVLGDGYFPVPHVFVEFDGESGPFARDRRAVLERVGGSGGVGLTPEVANRASIFPAPLPGEYELPPEGFDSTPDTTAPLSEDAGAKLKALLASLADRGQQGSTLNEGATIIEDRERQMRTFREWRETVALPLFATIVGQLRASGHSGRIAVRSVEGASAGRERAESVEVRVRLAAPNPRNPSYRPVGYVRLSVSELKGWHLDVWPSADESRGASNPAAPGLELMPKEQLEAHLLAMLKRLIAGGN